MPQWGKSDAASNAVLWGVTGFNGAPNTSNRTAFYDNNTPDAFLSGATVGQWGVDTTEIAVGNGPVNLVTIITGGSGYNGTVLSAITGGGGSGANVTFGTTNGRLDSFTINNGGSSYETNPTITVQAPVVVSTNGNTAVNGEVITLSSANSYFLVGDGVTISANLTSCPGGVINGTRYFVVLANTTSLKLSSSNGGAAISLTKASGNSVTAGGFGLLGDTATAAVVVGGAQNKGVTHAGWVVRKVGSGGRAGRVQYETLVAMGTITSDGSDDTVLPDSNS
jgi:hypothetical protein